MDEINEDKMSTGAAGHARTAGQHATRDKDATRQRLLDAAEQVFADKGYHGTVVDDIIRASDSSKGGFYFHFPNKQAIFLALVDKLVPKLAVAIDRAIGAETDPIAQLDAALRTVLETFARHRRLSKILLIEAVGLGHGFDEKLMRTRGHFAAMIQNHLDRAVAAGSIAPQDTTLVSWAWFGAINELVVRWLATGQPERLEETLPTLRTLLLRSVGVVVPAQSVRAPETRGEERSR
jgi:TetR/AcrR family transcriptional regulator, fatty acid metabolism regulator protein